MKKVTSYLHSLSFDKKLENTWYAQYIVQVRLVIMLVLSIVAFGLFSYFALPRRLNPEIKIPIIIVSTFLPGASPEDVETLVTIPLEDKIKATEGIDAMTSSSLENTSVISIQFLSSVNADKARDDVQSAVNAVTTLPTDAKMPTVAKLDFENQPVWNFVITTDKDYASLMRFSEIFKNKIKDLPKVDRVTTSGVDTQEIEVKILPEKIKEYNINPITLAQIVQKATNSYPSGNVQTDNLSFPVTINKDVEDIEDIRNIILTVHTKPVRLGDIATISVKSSPHQLVSLFATKDTTPKPAVQFFVYKTPNANIDAAEKDIHFVVDETIAAYNGEFQVTTIINNAYEIVDQFAELTKEFSTTILLVFILLLLFLGLRQAIISSITVPLTFLSSFTIIHALGMSLNFLTTFSFLIALGVLIDDAIVVVAAMTRYYATGKFTPAQTGVLVWRDFIVPLISTAVTTIWAFVPLLLAGGIIGEFIKTIPIVVTVTMISSTLIALLITLPLMIVFLKPAFPKRVRVFLRILGIATVFALIIAIIPQNILTPFILIFFVSLFFVGYRVRFHLQKYSASLLGRNRYLKQTPKVLQRISDKGLIDIEVLSRAYMRLIDRILVSKHGKRNTIIAITVFTLVAYLLIPLGFVKNEFFPKGNSNLIFITVQLPSGTTTEMANQETIQIINQAKEVEEVNFVVAESGAGFSEQGRTGSSNGLLVTLHLIDKKERSKTSSDIAELVREKFKNYSRGTLTIQEEAGGPPAGADLQITLLGDDLTELDKYTNRIVSFLEKQQGVTNINKSIKTGTSKIVFTPDKNALLENNLTVDSLSLWLRTYASGFTLDSIKTDNTDQDIILRLSDNLQTPEDIGTLSVGSVPLLSLGKLSLASNPTSINREKGKRSLTVTATVVTGVNIAEKNAQLEDFVKNKLNLATGYTWKTGGVNEENQKSVESILQAMILSFLLILVTMVIEFRSFRQTFIALMFIPLSISGVFYIFALTATPLSFPALIGVLALFGIVVRHAIVVIEKVNDNLREDMSLHDAVVDGAGNRLEPVLLTSLAAILGLIPITLSDPLWRGLGGAIIAGLLFSGAIKLFFVPVTYYLLFQGEKK